jgi:hypothetical protein
LKLQRVEYSTAGNKAQGQNLGHNSILENQTTRGVKVSISEAEKCVKKSTQNASLQVIPSRVHPLHTIPSQTVRRPIGEQYTNHENPSEE